MKRKPKLDPVTLMKRRAERLLAKVEWANKSTSASTFERFFVPVETKSEMNHRGHWTAKAARMALHRDTAVKCCQRFAPSPDEYAVKVRLIRVGCGRKLDDDNLRAALKGVRDGVAEFLGVDDGGDAVVWDYDQERGSFGVWVEIRAVVQ